MQDPVAFFISQLNSANKTEKRTSESDLAFCHLKHGARAAPNAPR
jgi:hypothetical protein